MGESVHPAPPPRAGAGVLLARLQRASLIVLGVGALAAVGLVAWLALGGYDVSAERPHGRISYVAIHAVMQRTVAVRSASIRPPARYAAAQTLDGFRRYDADCVACHGGPGIARAAWANRLTPAPPFLLGASRDWSDAELFWIVCHGVKMTAMPAWGGTGYRDADIWDVVAFLKALPAISPADYGRLRRAFAAAPAPTRGPGTAACAAGD